MSRGTTVFFWECATEFRCRGRECEMPRCKGYIIFPDKKDGVIPENAYCNICGTEYHLQSIYEIKKEEAKPHHIMGG